MSDAVSTMYGRADLSQDVANVIEEMGTIDFAQALGEFYPCRNMTPREYAKTHLTKRRVKFAYVGINDGIPSECPRGWDLLVVCGVVFSRRENEDLRIRLEGAKTNERVLVGIPLQIIPVVQQLRELCALRELAKRDVYDEGTPSRTGLETRRKFVLKQLRERAHKALMPGSFRWLCKGKVVEEAPVGTRNWFLSEFLQSIYHKSPEVSWGYNKSEYLEALDEMLDLAQPLQISKMGDHGAVKVLRRFMVGNGFLKLKEDFGSYSVYEVADYLEDSQWAEVWSLYMQRLIGDGRNVKHTELGQFTRELSAAPWGISRPVQALLLAALLRCAYPDFGMENDGEPVVLSGHALMRAFAQPKGWMVYYRPAATHEVVFLHRLGEVCATNRSASGSAFVNVWDDALRGMTHWYQQLSGVAKLDLDGLSQETKSFVKLLTDTEQRANPRELLGEALPALCGEEGIPLEEDQGRMLDWIRERCQELEAHVKSFQNRLAAELGRVLGFDPMTDVDVSWLDEQHRLWLGKMYERANAQSFSPHAQALLHLQEVGENAAQRWFEILPQHLDLPVLDLWTRDYTNLYKARLLKAKVELEMWGVAQFKGKTDDAEADKLALARWLAGEFKGLQLSEAERESVLLDLLERVM